MSVNQKEKKKGKKRSRRIGGLPVVILVALDELRHFGVIVTEEDTNIGS